MAPLASALLLAAGLIAGEGDFTIHLRAPAPEFDSPPAPRPVADELAAPGPIPYDDVTPVPADTVRTPPLTPRRKLGSPITIFVNFDGVHIGECNPSNSHENCNWLEKNTTFEPWSGSFTQRVAILDAMRSIAAPYGIRITGERPPDSETYAMVVYGGDSEKEEALGRAPAGDCWDDLPNEIAYVYLDGDRVDWVNGGASTAMHETGHTWGLDHIGLEGSLMAPSGDNVLTKYFDGCARVVEDTALTPGPASCPQINLELCGLADFQHDVATLHTLFGDSYVDDRAPTLELIAPDDGAYFQGPANFDVVLEVHDDLHPQTYEFAIGVPGLVDDPAYRAVLDPSFAVTDLPLGTWTFQLRLRDEAGNEAALDFTVEVGDAPPASDDAGCGCTTPAGGSRPALPTLALLLLVPLLRPRKPRSSRPLPAADLRDGERRR